MFSKRRYFCSILLCFSAWVLGDQSEDWIDMLCMRELGDAVGCGCDGILCFWAKVPWDQPGVVL